jgi:Domain of unknown function (DUF4386)
MTNETREASPQRKARIAGVFYLLNGGTGFAFSVRSRLIDSGDATSTASNILAHERLFRMALLADLTGIAAYVVVAALLYGLLKPVNRSLSLVSAFISLVGCGIQASACIFDLAALGVLRGGPVASTFNAGQSKSMALLLLRLQVQGFNIAIVFFGFYCLSIGYLIFRSQFMPRIVGALMMLSGLAYVTNNFAIFLAIPIPMVLAHLVPLLGGLGELSLMLWLLIMGVNAQRWREQPATAAR